MFLKSAFDIQYKDASKSLSCSIRYLHCNRSCQEFSSDHKHFINNAGQLFLPTVTVHAEDIMILKLFVVNTPPTMTTDKLLRSTPSTC